MDKGNWFWHSQFMAWVEGALLDLTNWVWNKRHSVAKKAPSKKDPSLDPLLQQDGHSTTTKAKEPPPPRKAPAKKAAKKAPAKKSNWTAK